MQKPNIMSIFSVYFKITVENIHYYCFYFIISFPFSFSHLHCIHHDKIQPTVLCHMSQIFLPMKFLGNFVINFQLYWEFSQCLQLSNVFHLQRSSEFLTCCGPAPHHSQFFKEFVSGDGIQGLVQHMQCQVCIYIMFLYQNQTQFCVST